MHIVVSNHSGVPIYEQIFTQIRELILTGELKDGEALPSIRQLARDLRISVITTTRAYSELEQNGFIATMQGKGCFVRPRNSDMMREQYLRRIEENLSSAIENAKMANITDDSLLEMLSVLIKEEKSDG